MADPNFNQNILNAQKKLNELYQGQKGFLESPENGYLTQASFVSLLTALQIEHKKAFPDFKPYSVSDLLKAGQLNLQCAINLPKHCMMGKLCLIVPTQRN